MSEVLALENITKTYASGSQRLTVLSHYTLRLQAGESVALVGPSGSGKTTLLHLAGLLDTPDSGTVRLTGTEMARASDTVRTRQRLTHLGFVYQFHHLLPDFTACENVSIPLLLRGTSPTIARKEAHALLETMGLGDRSHHKPAMLSGGEQQRVAIARALIHAPALIIADEPTGNLDAAAAALVFGVLMRECSQRNAALLMATHNPELAAAMSRTVTLSRG